MEVKSIKETHAEPMMQSVKFAKDEQSNEFANLVALCGWAGII